MLPLKDDIPTRRFPVLTVAIIVINLVVFFGFQVTDLSLDGAQLDQERVVKYALIPYEVTNPGDHCAEVQGQVVCEGQPGVVGDAPDQPSTWLTLLFAMFMHGGLLHIAGNMLFLWIFGNNIEDSMNRVVFLAFYLLGGIVASLSQVAIDPDSTIPTLGASGAIAAVLGGYAILYPRARVVTLVIIIFFVTILRLPALLVLGAWILLQFLGFSQDAAIGGEGGGGVAYLAHIGGFVFGLATIKLFATNPHDDYDRSQRIPVY